MENPIFNLDKPQAPGLSEPEQEIIFYIPKPRQTLYELRQLQQAQQRAKIESERGYVQNMSLNPADTNEIEFSTSIPTRSSRTNQESATKRSQEVGTQGKCEDKESLPKQLPHQTKRHGNRIRKGSGSRRPSGPGKIPKTTTKERSKEMQATRTPTTEEIERHDSAHQLDCGNFRALLRASYTRRSTYKFWKVLGIHGSSIPRKLWNIVHPHSHPRTNDL
jgi:hypothetical protein